MGTTRELRMTSLARSISRFATAVTLAISFALQPVAAAAQEGLSLIRDTEIEEILKEELHADLPGGGLRSEIRPDPADREQGHPGLRRTRRDGGLYGPDPGIEEPERAAGRHGPRNRPPGWCAQRAARERGIP